MPRTISSKIFGYLLVGALMLPPPVQAVTWADRFYLGPVISSGPYGKQKINVEAKRAISILNGTSIDSELNPGSQNWLIANIYHNKKFYIGVVPKNSVERVLLLSEPFFGVLLHSLLRFQFSEPVRLVAEVPTADDLANGILYRPLNEPIELKDLMLSVEATAPKGVSEFSAVQSFFNTRGLVFRWLSLTGLGVSKLRNGRASIHQYELNLSARERARTLRNALVKSDELGMSAMYNAALANCNQYCFKILERTSPLSLKQRTGIKKWIASTYVFAANFVTFTAINPIISKLGITWPMWRQIDSETRSTLEDDPEFQRLAQFYPKSDSRCSNLLADQ